MLRQLITLALALLPLQPLLADDTEALKNQFRKADGSVVRLRKGKTYRISQKLELKQLCPQGVRVEGNGATIQAVGDFEHSVLLTANVLLTDEPYDAGVAIRNLTLDGNGKVGRTVFGHWKKARIDNIKVLGGTIYQMNAIFKDSLLTRIDVVGNPEQTNNGFDCSLQQSTLYDVTVNMHGNRTESAFWLNGCKEANVINAHFIDGRTAFGLENCKGVNIVNMKARGEYTFRVANILPAEPSERIHLYNVDIDTKHIGEDPSTGVHFNATIGGIVSGGVIKSTGPGILLTHGATSIGVFNVDLQSRERVAPRESWQRSGRLYASRSNGKRHPLKNYPPVVFAGPDRVERVARGDDFILSGVVADERKLGQLKIGWKQKGGPARAKLKSADSPEASVTFPKNGVYHFVLNADDGKHQAEDDVKIKVIRGSERLTKAR